MKQTLLALVCLSAFSLAASAADNEKAKPDNTATNERDRSGETKTSGDQSNSSADLKITQAIRRALMEDRELSTTAKNIGKALRGEVEKGELPHRSAHG